MPCHTNAYIYLTPILALSGPIKILVNREHRCDLSQLVLRSSCWFCFAWWPRCWGCRGPQASERSVCIMQCQTQQGLSHLSPLRNVRMLPSIFTWVWSQDTMKLVFVSSRFKTLVGCRATSSIWGFVVSADKQLHTANSNQYYRVTRNT